MRCVFFIGNSKFQIRYQARARSRSELRTPRGSPPACARTLRIMVQELGRSRSGGTCNVNRNRGTWIDGSASHAQVIVRRLNYPRPCTTHVVHVCGHANGKDRARRNACFCLLAADLRRNYRTCNRRKVTQVFLRRALPTTSARRSQPIGVRADAEAASTVERIPGDAQRARVAIGL